MDRDSLRPPLDAAALRTELIGTGLGWRQLDVVEQTGSTNADLLARAASGVDVAGAVLIAEHQTAGRGRHGRGWSASPRAQITMSVGVSVVDVPVDGGGWLAGRGADWALAADYGARSLTIGSAVRAYLPGGKEVVGTASAIDDQGRLCLETSGATGGQTVVVSAGDVVHLR